jgi:PAS domain S-box-containing protein
MNSETTPLPNFSSARLNERNRRIEEYLKFLDEKPLGIDIKFRDFRNTLKKLISAKEELEEAWDSNPIPSLLLDQDLKILRSNLTASNFFDQSFAELKGQDFPRLLWKSEFVGEGSQTLREAKGILSQPITDANFSGSYQLISKPLSVKIGEKRVVYLLNLDAIILPATYVSHPGLEVDETDEKNRIFLALESGKNAVWDFDLLDGRAYFSPQYSMMLGYDPKKFPSSFANWAMMVSWEDRALVRKLFQDYAEGKIESHDLEIRMNTKSGRTLWVWSRGKVVQNAESGVSQRVIGTHVDITERKKAELRTEAVLHMNQRKTLGEESEENTILIGIRYALNLTESEWGQVRIRKNGIIEREYGLYLCRDLDKVFYLPIDDSIEPLTADKRLQLNFDLDQDTDFELTVAHKKSEFQSTDHKELQLLGSELSQVLISKRTEDLLRTSEWNLQSIVECSPNGILILKEEEIVFCNRSAEIILSLKKKEIIGDNLSNIFGFVTGEDPFVLIKSIAEVVNSIAGNQIERKVILANGRKKWLGFWAIEIIFNGSVCHLLYLNDLSRTKEAEVKLLHSEKLATIGQLAAGVAHEINNPMAFIQSNFDTLRRYQKRLENVISLVRKSVFENNNTENFEEIRQLWEKEEIDYILEDTSDILKESTDGSDRIVDIVKSIRNFAHEDKEDSFVPSNINDVIKSSINLIYNKIKYECEINLQLAENLPDISCRPQELGQVFLNLMVNAGHAIEEKKSKGLFPEGIKEKPGKIEIKTQYKKDYFASKRDAVEITFKDNGIGIPEDVLNRIFDPFFTTKEIGDGTGLGLSISMDIISKHSGEIKVESVRCQSTIFHIHIPVQSEEIK